MDAHRTGVLQQVRERRQREVDDAWGEPDQTG